MLSRVEAFAAVFVALFVVTLAAVLLHPKGQWRLRALRLKLTVDIPELTWKDLLLDLLHVGEVPKSGPLVTGMVRLNRRAEEGPCPYVFDTPLGEFRGRLLDGWLLESLMREQLREKIYDHPRAAVQPGDIVLDAGGHIGTFTKFALWKGARRVVAFEPHPVNGACFKQNLEAEIREGRVVLIEAAVWNRSEPLTLEKVAGDNTGSYGVAAGGRTSVQAVTIDSTVAELGLDRIDFIKMDIEGSERQALEGARETLSTFAPRMAVCVYHRPHDPQEIPRIVKAARPTYKFQMDASQAYFFER